MANFFNSGSYIPQQNPTRNINFTNGLDFNTFGGGNLPNGNISSGSNGIPPVPGMGTGLVLPNSSSIAPDNPAYDASMPVSDGAAFNKIINLMQMNYDQLKDQVAASHEAMRMNTHLASQALVVANTNNALLVKQLEQLSATVQSL